MRGADLARRRRRGRGADPAGQAEPRRTCAAARRSASVLKIFHFARFDIAVLFHTSASWPRPVYCTKIASRLTRTYTDRHGLKDLVRELLGVDLSKQQQSSDWGAETLSQAQLDYAASDVLYLHACRREARRAGWRARAGGDAAACFDFLPTRAQLDLAGWPEDDIFAHS